MIPPIQYGCLTGTSIGWSAIPLFRFRIFHPCRWRFSFKARRQQWLCFQKVPFRILLSFLTSTIPTYARDLDGQGQTNPGQIQLLLQPSLLEEMNDNGQAVANASFPSNGYTITTSIDANNNQKFVFSTSTPLSVRLFIPPCSFALLLATNFAS